MIGGLFFMLFFLILIFILIVLKNFKNRVRVGRNHLSIYFGIPGCGKTTIAACIAKKYLKYSKKHPSVKVFSNVPILGCYKYSCLDDLGKYDISNALIILDEASIEFNNKKTSTFPQYLIQWFKLHRHYHCEIVCFSQSWNDCEITLRRLAFQYWLVRPSLIPYVVQAVPIRRKIGINEQTNQPDDIYSFYPLLLRPWYTRNFFAPAGWKMFDSWEAPQLPYKEFAVYDKDIKTDAEKIYLWRKMKEFLSRKGKQIIEDPKIDSEHKMQFYEVDNFSCPYDYPEDCSCIGCQYCDFDNDVCLLDEGKRG